MHSEPLKVHNTCSVLISFNKLLIRNGCFVAAVDCCCQVALQYYVDATYCYRPSSIVCLSVGLSVCHSQKSRKNGWTDRDAVWDIHSSGPKELRVRWCAHWRHLENTTEPSMCGGDAADVKLLWPPVYNVFDAGNIVLYFKNAKYIHTKCVTFLLSDLRSIRSIILITQDYLQDGLHGLRLGKYLLCKSVFIF